MLVVGLFIGNILEVAAHVVRVTETAHWLEWQDWADPVLQKPYEIRDGLLHIPDVPGVGLEWNEEAVAMRGRLLNLEARQAHGPSPGLICFA